MGRTIVVAVDAREASKEAFHWALENLCKVNDRIALVNARPTHGFLPTGTDHSASTGSAGDCDDGYTLGIGNIMDELAKLANDRLMIKCDRVIKSGEPQHVLCDEVVIRDASALVMSSRGRGPVERAFLGSVSDYCCRNAECPVIVVRGKNPV